MSMMFNIEPEIMLREFPMHVRFKNTSSAVQDITVHFYADGALIVSMVATGVEPAEERQVVLNWDAIRDYFEPYLDRNISAYCEIPSPPAGVYLLGTTIAPATRGNALTVRWSSSTPKIKFIDELEKPIVGAQLVLYDCQSNKSFKYTSDSEGVFTIPSRILDTHGYWIAEMMKIDFDRRLVAYGCIPDYDFTDKTVKTTWMNTIQTTVEFATETGFDTVMKAITDCMPEPFRICVRTIAGWLGWLEARTVNLILGWFAPYASKQSGVRITSMIYDPDTRRVKANLTIAPFESPIAIPAIIISLLKFFGILIAIVSIVHVIGTVITKYEEARIVEERRRIEEQKTEQMKTITEAREKGLISEEVAEKALTEVTESMKYQYEGTPKTWLEKYGLAVATGVGGAAAGGVIGWAVARRR